MRLRAPQIGRRIGGFASKLGRDQRGSTYALMAAAIVPVLGMVGGGIDIGRAYMADSRLQAAVDAAVLAGARARQTDDTGADNTKTHAAINAYLQANFADTYMGFVRTNAVPATVTVEADSIAIALNVTGTVPTTLMRIFGIDTLPIAASAKSEAGRTPSRAAEVMLVLDNTGSMQDNGGMVALRASAEAFFDIVYGEGQTRSDIAIGIVPYAVAVNVGKLVPASMIEAIPNYTDLAVTSGYGWKGCVMADPTSKTLSTDLNVVDNTTFDMGKTMPGEKNTGNAAVMPLIKPAIYPPLTVESFNDHNNQFKFSTDTAKANGIASTSLVRTALISRYGQKICTKNNSNVDCTTAGSTVSVDRLPDYSKWAAPSVYDPTRTVGGSEPNTKSVNPSPNYTCPAPAKKVDYGHTRASLSTYIQTKNVPLHNIGTWHNQALTWGYRLLARSDLFSRTPPANKPVKRVLVFMTDGNFNSKDDGRDVSGTKVYDTAHTAYGSYEDKRITDTKTVAAHSTELAKRFRKTCAAAKAEGIEIYTITFAISEGTEKTATRDMFQKCSTNQNTHYFETQNTADLKFAFQTIAAELVDLHLSE